MIKCSTLVVVSTINITSKLKIVRLNLIYGSCKKNT
jgi:hypothetical protein